MTSALTRWYSRTTSRSSSGSSCSESAVEPTRSQNITVNWRRSAEVSLESRVWGLESGVVFLLAFCPFAPLSSYERGSAGRAELGGRPYLMSTARASPHECGSAFFTELGPFAVLILAVRAYHAPYPPEQLAGSDTLSGPFHTDMYD